MKIKNKSGYSKYTAEKYVDVKLPIYSLSCDLETQYKYEDNKRTDEITGYKSWFSQEGLPPFQVKFTKEIQLPKYLSLVEFEKLEACEIRYQVYFKANDIKEVK